MELLRNDEYKVSESLDPVLCLQVFQNGVTVEKFSHFRGVSLSPCFLRETNLKLHGKPSLGEPITLCLSVYAEPDTATEVRAYVK